MRELTGRIAGLARSLGILRYRPERWSDDDWAQAYRSGQLDYFADLDELPRYSLLVGYLRYFGGAPAVLDVGCGPGLLRARVPDDAFRTYLGVDTSADAIEQAQRWTDDRTTFRCGSVDEAEPGAFDVVILNEVLNFPPSPEEMILAAGEALAPGGLLLTSIWHHPGDRALWRAVDRHFVQIDAVEARNRSSKLARRGWRVACHRMPA